MLIRQLVVVGLVGFVSFAANIATAEDAVGPGASFVGADGVSLADASQAFPDRFDITLDSGGEARVEPGRERTIDWTRVIPFLAIHAGCLAVAWVGTSAVAKV